MLVALVMMIIVMMMMMVKAMMKMIMAMMIPPIAWHFCNYSMTYMKSSY